jgi:hypothetical protein
VRVPLDDADPVFRVARHAGIEHAARPGAGEHGTLAASDTAAKPAPALRSARL